MIDSGLEDTKEEVYDAKNPYHSQSRIAITIASVPNQSFFVSLYLVTKSEDQYL